MQARTRRWKTSSVSSCPHSPCHDAGVLPACTYLLRPNFMLPSSDAATTTYTHLILHTCNLLNHLHTHILLAASLRTQHHHPARTRGAPPFVSLPRPAEAVRVNTAMQRPALSTGGRGGTDATDHTPTSPSFSSRNSSNPELARRIRPFEDIGEKDCYIEPDEVGEERARELFQ
jgi:hypothetical protein